MRIYSRSEWSAAHPAGAGPARMPSDALWLHHTAGRSGSVSSTLEQDFALIRDLEAIGQSRFGRGISYTFVITRSGRIFEGTGPGREGSHTRGQNRTASGIVLTGNYQTVKPNEKQVEALAWLVAYGAGQGWWREPRLSGGHQDAPRAATACPGVHLMSLIPEVNGTRTEHLSASDGMPILGPDSAGLAAAQEWARSKKAHATFVNDILPSLHAAAVESREANSGRGIDFAVLVAQSAKETGWGRFGGVLDASFRNTAGIKTAGGGGDFDPDAHQRFPSWAEGARAHVNHLSGYVGLYPVGEPHPRYHTVARLSWAGSIKTVEELGARWAPSGSYGTDIVKMVRELSEMAPAPAASPMPAQAPESAPAERYPVLRRGARGDAVRRLQGILGVPADGVFGPQTERAVRAFQSSRLLTVDGVVGSKTWVALTATVTPRPTLRRGDRGEHVLHLQRRLHALNPTFSYSSGPGTFGPATEAEVRAHQRRRRITVDGVVGKQTWSTL